MLCRAQAVGSTALQAVYRQLRTCKKRYPVRFAGLYTDGGVDGQRVMFWVGGRQAREEGRRGRAGGGWAG